MTRYTNSGFKRKYLQAGFDDAGTQKPEVTLAKDNPEEWSGVSNSEPLKKKRKRSKKKTPETADEQGNTSLESQKKDEPLPLSNRKLYKKQRSKGV
jgi:hypothetical protein